MCGAEIRESQRVGNKKGFAERGAFRNWLIRERYPGEPAQTRTRLSSTSDTALPGLPTVTVSMTTCTCSVVRQAKRETTATTLRITMLRSVITPSKKTEDLRAKREVQGSGQSPVRQDRVSQSTQHAATRGRSTPTPALSKTGFPKIQPPSPREGICRLRATPSNRRHRTVISGQSESPRNRATSQ